jgi:hypothetical protein
MCGATKVSGGYVVSRFAFLIECCSHLFQTGSAGVIHGEWLMYSDVLFLSSKQAATLEYVGKMQHITRDMNANTVCWLVGCKAVESAVRSAQKAVIDAVRDPVVHRNVESG